ncbi:hypothetical protein F2Q70_00021421 [Brassica cretica]|uniref:Uncharacterized protein n=1 Tax=Brassica cretica TaxID=69181 RepID=A0A8S9GPH9_BRACR|nr:hypothetical protein F2Q70_00021421 [Brassica cretica]KAF2555939.1 hypothetical protein F2Q68_00014968 [Brassica cretica]
MLYIDNVDDETEDAEDDLDENFHGDDMPASHCNVDDFDYFVMFPHPRLVPPES